MSWDLMIPLTLQDFLKKTFPSPRLSSGTIGKTQKPGNKYNILGSLCNSQNVGISHLCVVDDE